MEQFESEAKTAGRLSHHHICRILDFGQAKFELSNTELKQITSLCMELMDGGSLADWIKEHKSISLSQVVCWVNKLGDALQYMHDQKVIHQGIKPTSIIFDRDNSPYLTDFAIASQTLDGTSPAMMGAPPYLAPEQWNGEEITPATDQYSLAVLTYFLVTGAKPYEGQDNPDVRSRNFRVGPVPAHDEALQNGRMGVSTAVSEVLARALAIKPKDRYKSVLEFARAFETAVLIPRVPQIAEPQVFISYHRDSSAGWATLLARELKQNHACSPFIDTQKLEAAVLFPVSLQKAIEQCDVFVCLLAGPTLESRWIKEEIRLAHENRKPMLPVFLDSFSNPKFSGQLEPYVEELLKYQGIPLYDGNNPDIYHTIAVIAKMVKRTVEQR
jgi:serine/threonine protein kinase